MEKVKLWLLYLNRNNKANILSIRIFKNRDDALIEKYKLNKKDNFKNVWTIAEKIYQLE